MNRRCREEKKGERLSLFLFLRPILWGVFSGRMACCPSIRPPSLIGAAGRTNHRGGKASWRHES